MVGPFRSGQKEETQDEVHRDEADADTTPTRTVAIAEGAMPLLA